MRVSIKSFLSHWKLDNVKVVRRVIISVVGATVVQAGVRRDSGGLAILATEYALAPRWLKKLRRIAKDVSLPPRKHCRAGSCIIKPSRRAPETRSRLRRIPGSPARMSASL